MSLTLGLSSALSGLMTAQRGLDTISQNVTNVNTKGYSRKTMNQESVVLNGAGAGVQVGAVTRMVNEGLLKDIRRQSTNLGSRETEQKYYPRIDSLFGKVSDNSSIANRIADMSTTFETLATQIDKPASMMTTVSSAQDIADLLGSMSTQMQDLRHEADSDVEQVVSLINEKLDNIHDLNVKIVKNGAIATGTADLEDKRDQELTELAGYMDIQYFKRNDDSVIIYSNSGQMLLDNKVQHLSYAANTVIDSTMTAAAGQFNKITVEGGSQDFGPELQGGKLKASLDVRDSIIPNLQANLDTLASNLKNTLNQVHNRGTSLPNIASSYLGTRTFAGQGGVNYTSNESSAKLAWGGNSLDWGDYTGLTVSYNAAGQVTMDAQAAGGLTGLTVGQTFSMYDSSSGNDGTYEVVSMDASNTNMVVRKANVLQKFSLGGSSDSIMALFDKSGDQVAQASLNEVMQTDFTAAPYNASPYDAAPYNFDATDPEMADQPDGGPWTLGAFSKHVESWLKTQGYTNAEVGLNSDGKMKIDLHDTATSLVFRDQINSTAGSDAADATINFDINGDGTSDQTIKGLSNFFGLNDFYVKNTANSVYDSAIQNQGYTLGETRDLSLYDTTGQVGNTVTLRAGSSLQDIADQINTRTRTTESVVLADQQWDLTNAAAFTVSDPSAVVTTLTVGPGAVTLSELAAKLTTSTITASVVKDGEGFRLRLSDARGEPLSVKVKDGDINSRSSLSDVLGMSAMQRFSAAVVPEGAGYRLRVTQSQNTDMFATSTSRLGANLLTDLGMRQADNQTASSLGVRNDLQLGPEKISRGTVQWNADQKEYYISEGDNTSVLAMSKALASKQDVLASGTIYAGKYTFAEFSASAVSQVSSAASNSKDQLTYQKTLNEALESQNSAYSGVNLDEEVSHMIDFQQAYSASAKVITALQDMLETLTSMIR